MIRMQIRTIQQAHCPICKKTVQVRDPKAEVYCHCDERITYQKEIENG